MLTTYALALLHTTFVSLAGFLLWKLWQRIGTTPDRRATLIVAIGFIARAAVAQALFWISYLRLPFAQSLQAGDGFWSLAIDGRAYFGEAQRLLERGWQSVLLVDKALPSPVFLQVLAVFIFLFGAVASVGALLNLFAYLGSCAAILRLGRGRNGIAHPALFALAALSFAPSVVLWSVQPLKDAFFMFAIVAFVAACSLWQEAWLAGRSELLRFAVLLLLILTALYAVVGIRWYCGLLLWGASLPFFVFTAMRSRRPAVAAAVNAGVFVAMSQALMFGAGPYFPPTIAAMLGHPSRGVKMASMPSDVVSVVATSRRGFERSPANTQIRLGTVLAEADQLATRSSPRTDTAPRHEAKARKKRTETSVRPHDDAQERARATADTSLPSDGMASASEPGAGIAKGAQPPEKTTTSAPLTSQVPATAAPAPSSSSRLPAQPAAAASSSVAAPKASPPSAPAPAATHPAPSSLAETHPAEPVKPQVRPEVNVEQKSTAVVRHTRPRTPVREEVPKIEPAPLPNPPAPAPPAAKPAATVTVAPPHPVRPDALEPVDRSSPALLMPESTAGRLAAGATAVVLPRFIGEAVGLIHVGGGRGLWALIELDTLAFDVLLFVVLYYVVRGIMAGGALRNPSFWLVLLMTAGIAFLLAYTISNFGTLFRHRAMILVGLCLLLVVAREAVTSPAAECP